MDPSPRTMRLAAIGLLLSIALVTAIAVGFYTRSFGNPAIVTVEADRAGLIMDPGNKVKARGVEIGRVGSVERTADGIALTLELDRDVLSQIPDNSSPVVRASTVFGAKYVELAAPSAPSGRPLTDGDTLRVAATTTEINTIFDQLDSVLSEVDTVALNTTLDTLSTSLGGRGDQIADLARKADAYLTELEPQLPELRRAFDEAATFSTTAEKVAPDFLTILANGTVTGETIADQQSDLHRLLIDLAVLSDQGVTFIDNNGKPLATLLKNLRAPTKTLRSYAPIYPCFFQGADRLQRIINGLWGNPELEAGLRAELSVRSKSKVYEYPEDLPAPRTPGRPNCHGLPVITPSEIPIKQVGESP